MPRFEFEFARLRGDSEGFLVLVFFLCCVVHRQYSEWDKVQYHALLLTVSKASAGIETADLHSPYDLTPAC